MALLTAAASAGWAHTPQAARAALGIASAARPAAEVVDAFHAALKRGDAKGAAALLAEDVLIFESGGAEHSKAEYLAEHLPADAEFARATTDTVDWRQGHAAGTAAWIASKGRTTGQFHGRQVNSRTTETILLRRTDEGWKIAHIHWSSAPVR
jgi:ketosteroid isomerase-like protein